MDEKKLNDMNVGMVISIYDLYGEAAAKSYILQMFSYSDKEATEKINEIIHSERYKEHKRFERRKAERRKKEEERREAERRKKEEERREAERREKEEERREAERRKKEEERREAEELKKIAEKKNTMVFIDAESVSADHCPQIIGQSKNGGKTEIRYYALKNDDSQKAWKEMAEQYGIKPILLDGEPKKNKIDKRIISDIRVILEKNNSIDIFCIASRDGDFKTIVKYIKEHHKEADVLATKNTSNNLKKAASKVKGI